jgi:hypothetical protein
VLHDLWQKVRNVTHESAELLNLLRTAWPGPANNAIRLFHVRLNTSSGDVVPQKVYLSLK